MTTIPESVAAAQRPQAGRYRAIVASTALLGGSSAINVLVGLVRTKAMALLLGTAGYGLMASCQLVCELARTLAQMGLNASGVRQIAAADAAADARRIALTVRVLRRTALGCGLVGGAALALLSGPVAALTFGDTAHAGAIAWLGLAVLLLVVAGGQTALLQGMRRIGDLSRMAVLGGLVGTLVGVPLVWAFGQQGVAPTLVAVAAATAASSWWYARRIRVAPVDLPWREMARESGALLRLGIAFMSSGLLTLGANYVARIIVLRHAGLDGAGLYQAAWTVGGLYVGFVLQAMGTEFYPRLVGAIGDPATANQMVNEQAQVGLLIALPGVVATLALAPLAIPLLYTESFQGATGALDWICLGMLLRVVTWPLGFVVIALDRKLLFIAIEAAWAVVNLLLTWALVRRFGVEGAGMAFVGAYVTHAAILYPVVRRANRFRWSRENLRLAGCGGVAIAALLVLMPLLGRGAALALGLGVTVAIAGACLFAISRLVAPASVPPVLARWMRGRAA